MQSVPVLASHPPWTAASRLIHKGDHPMHGYFSRRRSSSLEIAPQPGFQIPASACLTQKSSAQADEGGFSQLASPAPTTGYPSRVWIFHSSLGRKRAETYLLAHVLPCFLLSLQHCSVSSSCFLSTGSFYLPNKCAWVSLTTEI